jgi:colanic acid biosynthesis protein WcaH
MNLEESLYKQVMENMPIVCVDAIIMNEKGEYLLVKRKNEPLKNKFWMVGGRLYKNELTKDGIKRKIKEEVGIENGAFKYLGHFEALFDKTAQKIQSNFHTISFVYLVFISSSSAIKVDNQSSEYKWVKKLPKVFNEYLPWLKINNGERL